VYGVLTSLVIISFFTGKLVRILASIFQAVICEYILLHIYLLACQSSLLFVVNNCNRNFIFCWTVEANI